MTTIKIGKYRHYKGNFYEVIGLGRNSETLEETVIYKGLYDHPEFGFGALWVHTKENFLQKIKIGNKEIPRFEFIGSLAGETK